EGLRRAKRFVRRAVAVSPPVHRVADLTGDVVGGDERDEVHVVVSTPCQSSTSWTAQPLSAACAAAAPDASPSIISVGSIRTEPKATCDADRHTGTSTFVACSRFGVRHRYGIGYGGTATER